MFSHDEFLRVARDTFDPYQPGSGTEHVAWLLYGLGRMTRPRRVVEYGSGYTTLFLLAALAENAADAEEERAGLFEKTQAVSDPARFERDWADPANAEWYRTGGKACGVDPSFHTAAHVPHLYSFEERPATDAYTTRMAGAVAALGLQDFFTHVAGRPFSLDALPADGWPIDLAWNDASRYDEFFETVWPVLNPHGGLMIFHNTVAWRMHWEAIAWMKESRAAAGDLEVLTLPEAHKLNQNSCTILRRVTTYQPPCLARTRGQLAADVDRFIAAAGARA